MVGSGVPKRLSTKNVFHPENQPLRLPLASHAKRRPSWMPEAVVLRRWRFLSCFLAARKLNAPSMIVPSVAAITCCPGRVLAFSSPPTWPTRAQDPAASVRTVGTLDGRPRFTGDTPAIPLRTASRTEEAAIMGVPTERGGPASATMDT